MPYTYRTLTDTLAAAGIEEPAAEASILLCHLASVTYPALMANRDHLYDLPALDEAVARRLTHEPLQYILGTWDFMNITLRVNLHCLIPRPDTEILVEEALRLLPPRAHFADLCTGSGCIAIATLAERPDTTAVALELYPDTLALAAENAARNHVSDRFTLLGADLLTGGAEALAPHAPFDAILSNPPYIPTAVVDTLSPEVHHEPRAALDGGADGLAFYRAILRDYPVLVKPGGHLVLEIGADQGDALRTLAATHLPAASVRILPDLAGLDRVAVITLPA